jgi:hypothetical protein
MLLAPCHRLVVRTSAQQRFTSDQTEPGALARQQRDPSRRDALLLQGKVQAACQWACSAILTVYRLIYPCILNLLSLSPFFFFQSQAFCSVQELSAAGEPRSSCRHQHVWTSTSVHGGRRQHCRWNIVPNIPKLKIIVYPDVFLDW